LSIGDWLKVHAKDWIPLDFLRATVRHVLRIIAPAGTPTFELPETKLTVVPGPRVQLNLGVAGIILPAPGRYTVQVTADRTPVFNTSFAIEQGEEKEFQSS